MAQKTWTQSDVRFLRDHHRVLTAAKIAEKLGRSVSSVNRKAHKMGLFYLVEGGGSQMVVTSAKPIPNECAGCVWFVDDTAFGFCPFGSGCAKGRLK